MRIFIAVISGIILLTANCGNGSAENANTTEVITPTSSPLVLVADSFAYPIGKQEKVTAAKDEKDGWYNALDFGENNHLGEDWNKNSGGNTDCGEPVYSAANGVISFANDAGPGWGNVIIVTHVLPDGKKIQSLYGHLREIIKVGGEVKKRELIGKVGNANGQYLCHLHFELRESNSRMWDRAGPGYSSDRDGWLDPSDFIDKTEVN